MRNFERYVNQRCRKQLGGRPPAWPAVASVEDLAGKTVHVRRSSSYHESVVALNERFYREGKPKANIVLMPEPLEDEDMMEMLNAGVFQVIVVDDWMARMWSQVLPSIRLSADAALRTGANTGSAMRKESPQLMALVSDWFPNAVAMRGFRADRSTGYAKRGCVARP